MANNTTGSPILADCMNTLQIIKVKHCRTAALKRTFDEINTEIRSKRKEIAMYNEELVSNEVLLQERLKILTSLETEAEQRVLKISMWGNILDEKRSMLQEAKHDSNAIRKDYTSERIRYCDSISKFLDNEMNCREGTSSLYSPQDPIKLTELRNTVNQLEKELKEHTTTLHVNKLQSEELKFRKLLQERQADLSKISYAIKLKKLEKNYNLARYQLNSESGENNNEF